MGLEHSKRKGEGQDDNIDSQGIGILIAVCGMTCYTWAS